MDDTVDWQPRLVRGGESWASQLAAAIAADVASGRLAPGTRLPTQRALAAALGLTPGTVNRGYTLAERAGLVSGEVGRGTFVRVARGAGIHDSGIAGEAAGAIDLALNYPASHEAEAALRDTLAHLARRPPRALLGLAPYGGSIEHRAAGARWLRRAGLDVSADSVLLTTSVQHGLAGALAALTTPGDAVLTESLTSPGIKALAATHHLRLVGVAGDDEGLLPKALTEARRASGARVLYTTPTLHTPTTRTMSEARRRALAEWLRRDRVVAIEDDAWSFLAGGAPTPLQTLAPDNVVYLTSVSKCLAPGLRVGFVVAPPALERTLTPCLGALTWAAPLMAEVVARWIDDGTAARIATERAATASTRQAQAAAALGDAFTPPAWPSFHLWLRLPEPWRAEGFVAQAAARGVALPSTDSFVPGREPTPHAVRLCTGTEPSAERFAEGLAIVASLLRTTAASSALPGA